jgi:hypothetical protein
MQLRIRSPHREDHDECAHRTTAVGRVRGDGQRRSLVRDRRIGVNAVHISRAFETRAVELAFLLIRRPIKSRGYPAKQERLVTEQDMARLGM